VLREGFVSASMSPQLGRYETQAFVATSQQSARMSVGWPAPSSLNLTGKSADRPWLGTGQRRAIAELCA